MPRIDFDALPDDSRLWIFGAAEPLSDAAVERVEAETGRFIDSWAAHGAPLTGASRVVEGRFVLVGVDQASMPPSGCSIDAMVRVLKGLEGELGVGLVSHGDVYARDADGNAVRLTRADFKAAVAEGRFDRESRVFDTTLTDLGRYRGGGFEIAAHEGWHGLAFFRG